MKQTYNEGVHLCLSTVNQFRFRNWSTYFHEPWHKAVEIYSMSKTCLTYVCTG